MKVISPIFSSMRGTLGGAVGAVARGGVAYFRSRIIPSNPRTIGQTTARIVQTSLAAAWRFTLTDLQRSGWAAIAGATFSGINAFVKGNAHPVEAGQARTDDPPDTLAMATATPVTSCTVTAATHTVDTDEEAVVDGFMSCYVSAPQSPSRLSRQFNYTFVAAADIATGGPTVFTIPVGHPARNAIAGDIVYVRVIQWGDATGTLAGQVATAQEFRVVVA